MNVLRGCSLAVVAALACVTTACDVPEEHEDVEETEEQELGEVRQEQFCAPGSVPPTADATDTLIGGNTSVTANGTNSGCDLFTYRVTASAPTDRARYVRVFDVKPGGCQGTEIWVWKGQCSGGLCGYTRELMTVSQGVECDFGLCSCITSGELDLGSANTYEVVAVGAYNSGYDIDITVEQ